MKTVKLDDEKQFAEYVRGWAYILGLSEETIAHFLRGPREKQLELDFENKKKKNNK